MIVIKVRRALLSPRGISAFAAADLDELCCGTVTLSVPLLNNVIQVGIGGNVDTGAIEVSSTAASVVVRRMDDQPIQVEILNEQPGYTGPTVRTKVFRQPVPRLRLDRLGVDHGPALWLPAAPEAVNRAEDLRRFVLTLARFALAKQRRGVRRARTGV